MASATKIEGIPATYKKVIDTPAIEGGVQLNLTNAEAQYLREITGAAACNNDYDRAANIGVYRALMNVGITPDYRFNAIQIRR